MSSSENCDLPWPGHDAVVIVLAPTKGDAKALAREVETLGHPVIVATTSSEFASHVSSLGVDNVLLAVITEEGADRCLGDALARAYAEERQGSRLPVLFLVISASRPPPACRVLDKLELAPPPVVLERPVAPSVLRRILQMHARARRRQFKNRQLLQALEASEKEQKFLRRELVHRTMNTLAILQGLFNLSARKHDLDPEFVAAFIQRLQAINAAYATVSAEGAGERDLASLLDKLVKPYLGRPDQLMCRGSAVELEEAATFSLCLAVNELATNAAKYGSLSTDNGLVHITWAVSSETRELEIEWKEQCGPQVQDPQRRGLGTSVVSQIAGGAELHFEPDGVRWRAKLSADAFRISVSIENQSCSHG